MTLHIAIDEIQGLEKTTMTEKLQDYLTQKSYYVTSITQPQDKNLTYILDNYNLSFCEKTLIQALHFSLTSNWKNFEDYDIVIWRDALTSLAYYTNGDVKKSFIKNINKFSPPEKESNTN